MSAEDQASGPQSIVSNEHAATMKIPKTYSTERDRLILGLLSERSYVPLRQLSDRLGVSCATLRRDLERLGKEGKLVRVRGGALCLDTAQYYFGRLNGVPFDENVNRNKTAKAAIGKAAAKLCAPGEAVIIDGGSTTLEMCANLEPFGLQVFTNSLHIAGALLSQANTRISITGGTVFREQNIVLDPFDNNATCSFHASRMFLSAAAVNRHGLLQNDIILVQAEQKLLSLADELVALVDSSKFSTSAGHVLCRLPNVHTLITDDGIPKEAAKMLEEAGVRLITVHAGSGARVS